MVGSLATLLREIMKLATLLGEVKKLNNKNKNETNNKLEK